MGASVYAVLARFGRVDQDALAASFAEGYDFQRGYDPSMPRLLLNVRGVAPVGAVFR